MSFLPVGMMTDALAYGLATRAVLVVEIVFALFFTGVAGGMPFASLDDWCHQPNSSPHSRTPRPKKARYSQALSAAPDFGRNHCASPITSTPTTSSRQSRSVADCPSLAAELPGLPIRVSGAGKHRHKQHPDRARPQSTARGNAWATIRGTAADGIGEASYTTPETVTCAWCESLSPRCPLAVRGTPPAHATVLVER